MKNLVKAFTGKTQAPKVKVPTPAQEPPATPIPDPVDLEKSAMREELKRRKTGRASTILDEEDNL